MDLCYILDFFISTIDMRVSVNVIWTNSKSLCIQEGFLCSVFVEVKCICFNVKD